MAIKTLKILWYFQGTDIDSGNSFLWIGLIFICQVFFHMDKMEMVEAGENSSEIDLK